MNQPAVEGNKTKSVPISTSSLSFICWEPEKGSKCTEDGIVITGLS